jgi:peptidyl-prolyl cis-trans isomerase SurA
MKKILWLIPAVLFGVCGAEAKTVDRILAQVNDEIITMSEINRQMIDMNVRQQLAAKYSGDELEQQIQKAQKEILDGLIQEKLLYQKAQELGFNADTDGQVSSAIQKLMKDRGIKDTEELEGLLEQQGSSLKELRERYKRDLVVNSLVDYFVYSRITLLTPEIEKYYRDHLTEFSSPEEVTLSDIEISAKGNVKEAEERANDIYRKLQQGESFPTLASQYSNGTTANKGGSIGTYLLSTLNPDTSKAITGLKDGEFSKPQKEKDSYIIYRIDSRKPTIVRSLDEVRNEIKNRLFQQKVNPELERYVSQLKEDAYIQYFAEIK